MARGFAAPGCTWSHRLLGVVRDVCACWVCVRHPRGCVQDGSGDGSGKGVSPPITPQPNPLVTAAPTATTDVKPDAPLAASAAVPSTALVAPPAGALASEPVPIIAVRVGLGWPWGLCGAPAASSSLGRSPLAVRVLRAHRASLVPSPRLLLTIAPHDLLCAVQDPQAGPTYHREGRHGTWVVGSCFATWSQFSKNGC
jgi:hypothetical protein